ASELIELLPREHALMDAHVPAGLLRKEALRGARARHFAHHPFQDRGPELPIPDEALEGNSANAVRPPSIDLLPQGNEALKVAIDEFDELRDGAPMLEVMPLPIRVHVARIAVHDNSPGVVEQLQHVNVSPEDRIVEKDDGLSRPNLRQGTKRLRRFPQAGAQRDISASCDIENAFEQLCERSRVAMAKARQKVCGHLG